MDRTRQPKLRVLRGTGTPSTEKPTFAAVQEIHDALETYNQAVLACDWEKAERYAEAVLYNSQHLYATAMKHRRAFDAVNAEKARLKNTFVPVGGDASI